MAKFSNIVKGTRALKSVAFTIWGTEATLAVRPMTGVEEGEAFSAGRAYAVCKGVAEPKDTDRVYEIGVMSNTIAIACVDPDAPDTRYFANAAEVMENLDTDRIAYLFEAQQLWQDECSPRITKVNQQEWAAMVIAVAEAAVSDNPLARWRPVTQRDFTRILASRYMDLLLHRSNFGLTSEPSTTTPQAPKSDG